MPCKTLFWILQKYPFASKAFKMKVAGTFQRKFSMDTLWRQEILNTSNDGKQKDFNNNKKGFSGINKELP